MKVSSQWRRLRVALFGALAALGLLLAATPVLAGSSQGRSSERALSEAAKGNFEVLEQADQYAEARTAPADMVDAGAFSGAYQVYQSQAVPPGRGPEATGDPAIAEATLGQLARRQ